MMQTEKSSIAAISLSVLTAALAAGVEAEVPVRSVILGGAVQALLVTITLQVLSAAVQKSEAVSRAACLAAGFWLLAELGSTVIRAQSVCRQEFHSMALIGFLPLLLWAGCRLSLPEWEMPARVLWWFILLGGVICLAGVCGQMDWAQLLTQAAVQQGREPTVPLYAEYLLCPLLATGQKNRRKFLALPWLAFLVQAGTALGMCLVFGAADYPAKELLRAWSAGVFSRMDAFLLLIWLTCAIFRIGFLCTAARTVWHRAAEHRRGAAQ